jgi:hypothetical protein
MNLFVGPFIRKDDFSGISLDIGERIKQMSGVANQSLANPLLVAGPSYVRSSVGIREGGYFLP